MKRLSIPGIDAHYKDEVPEICVLLVAGGREPQKSWLQEAAKRHRVWAVDRGVESCMRAHVLPELVIGDSDSGSPKAWEWARSVGAEVHKFPRDKDLTDLQLALRQLASLGLPVTTLLCGGWGMRFDHAWSNLFSLIWASKYGIEPGCICDEKEVLFFLRDGDHVELEFDVLPKAISLLSLSPVAEGVTADGVKWPLKDKTLFLDEPYAVSNVPLDERVAFGVKSGWLGVYCTWEA
ncbi:MAG TPA: thiamine diphosphokinase [Thermosynergistes sp.]|nr:thiamine diphosphokinase [Thermosynergistes sp.]